FGDRIIPRGWIAGEHGAYHAVLRQQMRRPCPRQLASPVKLRQTFVGGSKKMIVYDDLEPTEMIKVYDKGITVDASPENAHPDRLSCRRHGGAQHLHEKGPADRGRAFHRMRAYRRVAGLVLRGGVDCSI